MRKPINIYLFFVAFISLLLTNCNNNVKDFIVKDFNPMANLRGDTSQKAIFFDYTNAISEGFIVPTVSQVEGGKFAFSFSIKNNSGKDQQFYYKIFYQNESYKFPEEDELSAENFYGSWEDVNKTFAETSVIPSDEKYYAVTDSFRIVGNPRDEKKYYGVKEDVLITDEELEEYLGKIHNSKEWVESITKKAKAENIPVDV
jgi:hypothetical protein